MGWPKKVPILEPSDICKGQFSDGTGKHCLVGWVEAVFKYPVRNLVLDELKAIVRNKNLYLWSDTHKSRHVAAAWNVAIFNFGFTEAESTGKSDA